ncbi:MAG: DoxX family protein [Candidatus Eisenbacteria bacterium]
MSNPFPTSRIAPQLLSVLRIVGAFLFIAHGSAKLLGFPIAPGAEPHLAPTGSLVWVAAWLEFVGGALVLVGAFTRPIAFLLSGLMAVAYFMSHAPNGFWPLLNRGELAVLFSFLFLYLSAAGPGPWSVDAVRGRSK